MKAAAVLRGGALAGVLMAGIFTAAGTILDIGLPPWSWSAATPGLLDRAAEWAREFGTLLPLCIVDGVLIAFAYAVLSEYVVGRASVLAGALVGLATGTMTATVLGLIPWITFWFAYDYAASSAPLGPYNASWLWLALLSGSALAGATAGATYGPVRPASRPSRAFAWRETYSATRHIPL